MTNVLVPTDFSAASLRMVEVLLKNDKLKKCNIVLFHAFELPNSPFDLLASTEKDPASTLMNEPFRQACKQLKDQYPSQIGKIIVRCMTGDTRSLFKNFLDANDIDLIYCPDSYVYKKTHYRSIDPCYFFDKCGIPVVKTQQRKAETVYTETVLGTMQLSTS